MFTQEEIEQGKRFYRMCESNMPSRPTIARYTAREWKMFNFLPSFGLVGNKGYAVRHVTTIFKWKVSERLRNYNEFSPTTIS